MNNCKFWKVDFSNFRVIYFVDIVVFISVNCSACGAKVKKALSTRTHRCKCGCVLDRDQNAARNILSLGLNTAGRAVSAWGDKTSI